jgi:hypothetical protein
MSSLGAMFDAIVRAGRSDMIWFFMACGARGLLRGEVRRLLDQPDVLQQRRTRGPAVIMLVLSATGSPVRS